jgi:hypothetical protein
MKEKILGRIGDDTHRDIKEAAQKLNLTIDQFLVILLQNWKIYHEQLGNKQNKVSRRERMGIAKR